jgi:alpha-glucosidase
LAALLLLTLRGSPFLYYGDELGMRQATITEDRARDPWGYNVPWLSRDGARTPMQWSPGENAGFTSLGATSWLPVGPDHEKINVETELGDAQSTLNLYRRLLALRKTHPALRVGSYLTHPSSTEDVLVYRRESDTETMTVALNFSNEERVVRTGRGQIVFSTADENRSGRCDREVTLAPTEGLVVDHT